MTSSRARRLTVAVATYRRPEQICTLVPVLLAQLHALEHSAGITGRLVVVDNDPAASARSVLADRLDELTYVVEAQPGISAARNRALDEAVGDDLLAFLDDDERPAPEWLECLVAAQREHSAAAVAGPVRSLLDDDVDPWIRDGGFFDRRHRAGLLTGTPIPVAATNNLLLELAVVRDLGLRFDPAFGLRGGGDSLFTQSLTSAGATMVWCAEAEVTEVVPGHRLSRRWVLLRQLRSGNSAALVDLHVAGTLAAQLAVRRRYLVGGAVRLVGGLLRAGTGRLFRRRRAEARGARTAARGAGMLGGAVGWTYEEYRRPSIAVGSGAGGKNTDKAHS